MADTKWCPQCGAEYVPSIVTCVDCHVALVDREPVADPTDASDDPDAVEPEEFDLVEWPQELRNNLEWMLGGAGIAFEWIENGVLVVPGARADEVEGFLDYLAAGPPDELSPETDEWRTAAHDASGAAIELSADDFYDGDPARMDSEEEQFGLDWSDSDGVQCEVNWVHDTGELYLLRAPKWEPFMVEILTVIPALEDVERLLAGWEDAIEQPNSVQWVRDRLAQRAAQPDEPPDEAKVGATESESPLFDALDEKLRNLESS